MKKKIIIGIIVLAVFIYIFSYFSVKSVPKIAVININGVISSYEPVIQNIETAQIDSSIKAVVIAVDSPGGAVGAAQEIYSAIEKLRKEKPVVVSMGNVAASGGYYVSVPANVIYANPGTITGSIGVIIQHVSFAKVLEKLGIKVENIKSGQNKDILYPNRELTPQQKKLLEETIKDVYNQFLEDIVKYRKIDINTLKQYADGRIFTGRQAKKLKLIDKLGNIQDAVEEAKKLAGLEGKKVMVIKIRKEESILKKMLQLKLSIPENLSFPQFYYLLSF
ncbi:signal peptide peptidase SppA [Persephonella atlantica]|uniref:Signal peptide peptidase SppA n=1 Tax=Persephonella atlantica TaxID=2699429 RepID=A0ABS1GID7_9AQUI|nr:signal peptide peptidase SppA [Persephonella atlantica]MBK3332704.1 signal peptide peptidase SppA [Persephonella atlantica]